MCLNVHFILSYFLAIYQLHFFHLALQPESSGQHTWLTSSILYSHNSTARKVGLWWHDWHKVSQWVSWPWGDMNLAVPTPAYSKLKTLFCFKTGTFWSFESWWENSKPLYIISGGSDQASCTEGQNMGFLIHPKSQLIWDAFRQDRWSVRWCTFPFAKCSEILN